MLEVRELRMHWPRGSGAVSFVDGPLHPVPARTRRIRVKQRNRLASGYSGRGEGTAERALACATFSGDDEDHPDAVPRLESEIRFLKSQFRYLLANYCCFGN